MKSIKSLRETLTFVLAGGQGERLYPLTKGRSKPAVPFGGHYRIIDFTLSNCVNSGLMRIFVLTQYRSLSLDRHLKWGWNIFSSELGEYLFTVPPQQRISSKWYQGTADAIYQNIYILEREKPLLVLILYGDHVYQMDYSKLIQYHIEKKADLTISTYKVPKAEASRFGVLETDEKGRVVSFQEKPEQPKPIPGAPDSCYINMGIYLFNKDVMVESLNNESAVDFGKHVIPNSIESRRVYAYFFDGYWEDVGTIRSFYEANLKLTQIVPEFDFYDESTQVYTHPRFLPGSKINSCVVQSSVLCEGSVLTECEIRNSIIGVRSIVRSGAEIQNSVIMGADYYETIEDQCVINESGLPSLGIGRGSIIRNAIVDKNARIGCNVRIINQQDRKDYDGPTFSIRDGIVVIHRNAVIPDNTVI